MRVQCVRESSREIVSGIVPVKLLAPGSRAPRISAGLILSFGNRADLLDKQFERLESVYRTKRRHELAEKRIEPKVFDVPKSGARAARGRVNRKCGLGQLEQAWRLLRDHAIKQPDEIPTRHRVLRPIDGTLYQSRNAL
jgi:hypothetical protein